jgi:hypothetical protein
LSVLARKSGNTHLGYLPKPLPISPEAGSASHAQSSGAAVTAVALAARCHVLGLAAPVLGQ